MSDDDIVEVSALTYDQLRRVARKLDCTMEAALEHVLGWWFAKEGLDTSGSAAAEKGLA